MKFGVVFLAVGISLARAQSFEVFEASIADEQKAMTEGRTTSKALVQAYLRRIEAFDQRGPRLNAVITLNPKALDEAEALDRERAAKGPRGPLHGIPVVLKDNYSTSDMATTAGTLALAGFVPARDAFQVTKLRAAGAVILGKTNLHELASGITTISSAGGQTLNPYDPGRNPGGSSGGTGAAVAASFAAAGMGSDTCGSIRIPSAVNNLVGLRPTKGLSSITGIVPLSVTQDVGGPLARSVGDLAAMLDATVGEDPADPATHLADAMERPGFVAALRGGVPKGARIGVLESLFGDLTDDAEVVRVVRGAGQELKKAGFETVSVALAGLTEALEGSSVIDFEFKEDLAAYLAGNANAPVHSLKEIIDSGLSHASLEGAFRRRVASKGRDSEEYRKALLKRAVVADLIVKFMDEQKLDAVLYPTLRRKPARIGDVQGGTGCQLSASTGLPAISMPAGFTADGLPLGAELLGRRFDDAKLVAFAFAYEQATHHRKPPARTPALGMLASVPVVKWAAGPVAFTFDPATSDLGYRIMEGGMAATLHRAEKDGNGPVIAVLASREFRNLAGTEKLGNADREKLMAGELYLRIATRASGVAGSRVPLKPPVGK